VVLVLVLAAIWAGTLLDDRLRAARERDARAVVPAVTRGDCVAAAAAYRGATTGLLLASYLEFRRTHVFSPLYQPVRRRIQDVLRDDSLRPEAETCRLVALAAGGDRLPDPADVTPALLTACGELLGATGDTRSSDGSAAQLMLATVRKRHGGSPEAARAEAAEAAMVVASARVPDTVVTPRRTGTGSHQAKIVVTNAARAPLQVTISGPRGGRIVELGPCARCPKPDPRRLNTDDAAATCDPAKGRRAVVTLPPGTYRVYASRPILGRLERWTGTWKLRPGTYAPCL
jgi:hypothetical protein